MTQKRAHNAVSGGSQSQRLDKWLWFARLAKTRTLATTLVGSGKIRVNRQRISKPSSLLRPGDVVTASIAKRIRVLKVLAPGHRRGPATEAQELYEDLTPADIPATHLAPEGKTGRRPAIRTPAFHRAQGTGRPTKRDRRLINRLKGRHGDQ